MSTRTFATTVVASTLAMLSIGTAARADVVFDFNASDGGWTAQTLSGSQSWFWNSAAGAWRVATSSAVGQTRLTSPVLTTTGTSAGVIVEHRYNFEPSGSSNCFDGGNVKYGVNGGPLGLATFDTGGYVGPISTSFGNPMGGQGAWCGASAGWITPAFVLATESGAVAAGATYQFAFDAGWDSSVLMAAPNWEITRIELRGFELAGSAVPEPATLALFGIGLAGFAASRRRKQ